MKTKIIPLFILLILVMLLTACGPSPEQIATMTASAWTPTPVPPTITPSPTPIPYDLTVTVTDADGNPIAGANVVFPESGSGEPVAVNETGQISWNNLGGPNGLLTVSAQGYLKGEQPLALERGLNEVTVKLERDLLGLLPTQACGPTETLLYIEDFQDNESQGWPEIDLHANGWNISEYAAEPGNIVANNNSAEHPSTILQDKTFADAVWRVKFFVDGRRAISFNWQQNFNLDVDGEHVDNSRYQVVVDTDGIGVRRLTLPVLNIGVTSGRGASAGTWHNIEISTYQSDTQIWMDGNRIAGYTDPKPLPSGGIGLEIIQFDSSKPDTTIYFDNIAVCELSAPFTSIYSATP